MGVFQSSFVNLWSALEWTAIESRHKDLVYLVCEDTYYRIYSSKKITPSEISILDTCKPMVVIAQGQISRDTLDKEQKTFLQDELDRIRRH